MRAKSLRDPVVAVGTRPTGVALGTTMAYVANQGSNTVSVIDLTTDTVAATIAVGVMPNAAALSADGSRLYVSNFGDGTESIISTSTNTVTHTVAVGKNPTGVVEVGGLVYVANLLGTSISVIDPSAGTVVRTIALSTGVAPSGLAASADGHTLYANDARNGRTYVIDLTQSPPVVEPGFATVGVFPAYLSVAGTIGYVANPGSNSISVLDLSQSPPATSASVTVGSSPYGVVAMPSLNQVFATNSGSNNVSVIDTSAAPTVASTVGVGSVPLAIAVSPDKQTAMVSNEGSNDVSIFHVNQPPVNVVPGAQTVTYNATTSAHNHLTFSGTISTSDVDAGSAPVAVTLGVGHGTLTLGSTSNLSGLSGNGTGTVSFTGSVSDVNNALNGLVYEPASPFTGSDPLSLTVDDQGNTGLGTAQSAKSTVPITVQDSAPTDIALSNSSVDENKPSGTTVGSFSTTDPDPGDTFSYSLVSGTGSSDNGSFQIVGSTLQTNATFDFETKSSYSVRVRSTDAGGQSFEKQFTITINDVNEAPTDISLSKSNIDENQPSGTTVGTLTATDQDAGQTHSFSLQGSGCGGGPFPDNGSFQISGSTLQSATSFDFETKSSYTICIRTTDSGSPALSFDKQFTIQINDVNDPPVAVADTYNDPVGNTLAVISTSPSGPQVALTAANAQTGSTLIANDTDQDKTFPHTLSAVAETVSTAHGGTATINSDGSFTFLPKAGDRNTTDSFTYHVTDGSLSTAGTVNIQIGNTMVWYVNNALGSNGDGRSSSPFNSLSGINGAGGAGDADSSGDILFLYQGSGNYGGGLPLEASQQLIGQPQGLTLAGNTIVPAGGSNPTITNSGGAAITLADGNTIQRVDAKNASGAGLTGSAINTLTYGANTTISGNAGGGLVLSGGGNGTINVGANISQSNTAGHSVSISGRTGGTTTLTGTINDTGAGITLSSNTGATINLNNTITANTGANTAFSATGGGTTTATGTGNTLATSTATALNVSGTTIGSSGLTFASISAGTTTSGPTRGISLVNTGSSGGLTVSGSGTTAGSGGTIQHTTSSGTQAFGSGDGGIYLSNTANVSLTDMNVSSNHASGIYGTGVTNLTLTGDSITANGTSNTNNDDGVRIDGITGTGTIGTTTISGSAESDGRIVSGTSGSLTMNVTGSTFSTAAKGFGLLVSPNGASVTTTATGNTFNQNFSDGLSVLTTTTGTGTITFTAKNNTVTNNTGAGIVLGSGSTSGVNPPATFTISSNSVTGQQGSGINVLNGEGGTWTGHVTQNTVGNASTADSGSKAGWGVIVKQEGPGTLTADVSNNTIRQIQNLNGVEGSADTGAGTLNLTMTGNNIDTNQTTSEDGIFVNTGVLPADTSTVCLNASSNTSHSAGTAAGNGLFDADGMAVDNNNAGTTFKIAGLPASTTNDTTVANYLASKNTLSGPGGPAFAQHNASGSGFTAVASCPTAP